MTTKLSWRRERFGGGSWLWQVAEVRQLEAAQRVEAAERFRVQEAGRAEEARAALAAGAYTRPLLSST
jgi:hypothetical protein